MVEDVVVLIWEVEDVFIELCDFIWWINVMNVCFDFGVDGIMIDVLVMCDVLCLWYFVLIDVVVVVLGVND